MKPKTRKTYEEFIEDELLEMSTEKLKQWTEDMPEPYASLARTELIKRGVAL